MAEEEKAPEQIPWAERVKVIHQSDSSVDLEYTWHGRHDVNSKTKASIWHRNFEWSMSMDSRIEIRQSMELSDVLTRDIREWWEQKDNEDFDTAYKSRILGWLKGGIVQTDQPAGPKEWRPKRKISKIKAKLTDSYGYANTYNEDNAYWWGDVFEYAHFKTEDDEEGAVVMWSPGGSPTGGYLLPEVYLGNFEEFMESQYEHSPWDIDTFLGWNRTFENGFMWAWEKMGVFDDPDEHITRLDDEHVKQVLGAIEQDPSILLPESVEKILLQFEEFPQQIQNAVAWLMANKRRELEQALGQKLIWGDLYAD